MFKSVIKEINGISKASRC